MDYSLLDSGNYLKLEKFGKYIISRPCAAALWMPNQNPLSWQNQLSASFKRNEQEGQWTYIKKMAESWNISLDGVVFELKCTDFGHLGLFPEHSIFWPELREVISKIPNCKVLNLFAYTGGSSIVAALAGATVIHVDASKAAVRWAEKNVSLNNLTEKRIFWVIEDVLKFLYKEQKRKKSYDIIILDPPTYGRGTQGEIFKIQRDLYSLLKISCSLLSERARLLFLSTHTLGHTPLSINNVLKQHCWSPFFTKGQLVCGELSVPGKPYLPSGVFGKWIVNDE